MLAVPGMTVTAPKDATEMLALMRTAADHHEGPFCLRYPRDSAPDAPPAMRDIPPVPYGTWDVLRKGGQVAVLAAGTMVLPAMAAAEQLASEGLDITVVNCRFLKPYDSLTLAAVLQDHRAVLVVEEGTVVNGFGAYMAQVIDRMDSGVRVGVHGVPDTFIEHAPRKRQLAATGLDPEGIAARVRALLESEALAG
jgi:1-deoxy-D-xylulose-5-phosphate synthase